MLDNQPVKQYSREELITLLEKLMDLGLTDEQQKDLNGLTIEQLDDIVNNKNLN